MLMTRSGCHTFCRAQRAWYNQNSSWKMTRFNDWQCVWALKRNVTWLMGCSPGYCCQTFLQVCCHICGGRALKRKTPSTPACIEKGIGAPLVKVNVIVSHDYTNLKVTIGSTKLSKVKTLKKAKACNTKALHVSIGCINKHEPGTA